MMRELLKLSTPDLLSLAVALRGRRLQTPFTALGVQRFAPPNVAAAVANDLQSIQNAGYEPEQIALLLDAVTQDRQSRQPVEDSIDLVTTGPDVQGVTNRDTGVVVRELFSNAHESVLVAGYAIYQGHRVFQMLADRMVSCPSLKVRMFLDVQRGQNDSSHPSELLRRYAERFRLSHWPQDRPFPEVWCDPRSINDSAEKKSCLHAKCVVVDRQHVFVSSANFTEAAQERNIEVGLLIHSRTVADRLCRFFEGMLAEGMLQSVL